MTAPVDPDHFSSVLGVIQPQPWMQYRWVATGKAVAVNKSFNVIGSARDDLVHTANAIWKNNTPINQYVYGLVTRGGCRVALQARTKAYLKLSHAAAVNDSSPGDLVEVSKMGCGMELGRDGALATDAFGIIEVRQSTVTMPLMPKRINWTKVEPQETFRAKIELRWVSEFWENTSIDGGNSGSESSYSSGDTRIDLFAIPII